MRIISTTLVVLISFGCSSLQPDPVGPPSAYAGVPLANDDAVTTKPKVTHRVEPYPPPEFRKTYASAVATVEFVIDEEGKVVAAWCASGNREWANIMIQALRQWRWEPARTEGRPLSVRTELTSTYKRSP